MAITKVTNRVLEDNSVGVAQLSAGAVPTKLGSEIGAFNFRNKVINGNFDIWQRGTSYTGNVTTPISYPAADRWAAYSSIPSANSPSGTYTVTQRTTNNTELQNFQANYYQRFQTNITTFGTTPMTSYLNGAFIAPGVQGIENAASILGKTVTVTFWARASQNCKLLSESQIYSTAATAFWTPAICKLFDVTTSWQKFTHTYTMPTYNQVIAAGYNPLLNYSSNPSYTPLGNALPPLKDWLYQVNFVTMWSRGLYNAAGNHVNRPAGFPNPLSEGDYQALLASAEATKNGGWIDISQVQLEEGSYATPFEQRPIGTELALCQRYYQYFPSQYINSVNHAITVYYKTSMRTNPQITWGGTFATGYPTGITTESFIGYSTSNSTNSLTLNAEL